MKPLLRKKSLPCLLLALACPLALAAPKDELHEAFAKFLQAKSFRATTTDAKQGKPISTMEFVAPDRYRVDSDGRKNLIVGDSMYMDVGGQLTKIPVPGVGRMIAQYRDPQFLAEIEDGLVVQALGEETVDGEPAKVYAYRVTRPVKADAKTWVSRKNGLPIQTESTGSFLGHASTTRVRYSAFDDPSIRIDAPR